MDAKELRIGNMVTHKDNVCEVYSIDSDWITIDNDQLNTEIKEINPIPLTEEWLLRFGFTKKESSTCNYYHIGRNEITHDYLFDVTWLLQPELIQSPNAPFYRNGAHHIYFVHQLQNLYFALTNKELEIKK